MIRSFLTVSTGTLASRLLGFARDSMIAALLGAGPVADAFLLSFQLVNVIRRLLTEGALNAALVPAWLRVREAEGAARAAAFAGRVLGSVSALVIAATAVVALLMPLIIAAVAPGFRGHAMLQFAVQDVLLMLPYIAFAGPVAVMMGLMNAQNRFALTAFSPLLFNIVLIAVMLVLIDWRQDAARAALIVAATVGVAGVLQLSILLLGRGGGIARPVRIAFDAEMRGFLGKAMPAITAISGPQLLILVGAFIASSSPAALTWLYLASRLVEMPLGIVGAAISTVLMPELTRALRAENHATVAHAESRSLELAVALALPATLGLIVLGEPLVRLLFEHGVFTASDAAATAQMLRWLALALPAHVLVKAMSPAFFARQNSLAPLLAMLKGLAVAIVSAVILGEIAGPAGIAAGIACGAWSNALALIRSAASTFGLSVDLAARRRLPRIVAAGFAMGGLLWLGLTALPAPGGQGVSEAMTVLVLIVCAVAVYGLLLGLTGVISRDTLVKALKQAEVSDLHDRGPRGN
jgi:putative peptidoglycan lipid II flippase